MNADPRATRIRQAILEAAARILATRGVGAVTHQLVAAEAQVGRATVYRHWAKPLDLLLDAMELAMPSLDLGDGDIRTQLISELTQRLAWFNEPIASAVIAAMIGRADHEPRINALRHQAFGIATSLLADAIAQAIARGELSAETPARRIASSLIASLVFERHLLGATLTSAILEQIVDTALKGWIAE